MTGSIGTSPLRPKVYRPAINVAEDVRNGFLHAEESHCDTGVWIVVSRNDNSKTIQMYCNVVGLAFWRRLLVSASCTRSERYRMDISPPPVPYISPRNSAEGIMPHSLGGLGMEFAARPVPWRNPQWIVAYGARDVSRTATLEAKMRDVSDRSHV